MTNIELMKEKLKNIKDSEGNVICVVEDDLLDAAINAVKKYTFSEEHYKENIELSENDLNHFLNKPWSSETNSQGMIGTAEIESKYDRLSVVYRDKKAESIYFTTMPGLSVKKYYEPDGSSTIVVEGYAFAYHKFDNEITRDCDIDFIIGENGKVSVRQKVTDCNQDFRIMDRSESVLLFDSFQEFEQYHKNLDEELANYSHKKINISK